MKELYIVRKPFDGAGERRVRGEVVDAGDWRTTPKLVSGGYLQPAPGALNPRRCRCGRSWIDGHDAHSCADGSASTNSGTAAPAQTQPA